MELPDYCRGEKIYRWSEKLATTKIAKKTKNKRASSPQHIYSVKLLKTKIREFLDSFRYQKSANVFGVAVRKSQIRKFS